MPAAADLWCWRHAQALIAPGVCYGQLDVPADAVATAQAAQAAASTLPARVTRLRVSALQRAQQLAAALVSLRPGLSVHTDARLNEMDFGAWEGQPWDAIPRAAIDAWTADFGGYAVGGGESVRQLLARVQAALAEVQTEVLAVGQPGEAWITHAGVIRALIWAQHHGWQTPPVAAQWPQQALPPGTGLCVRWPPHGGCGHR